MISSRGQESPLRLENLGHVSAHYGSLPRMTSWSPDGPIEDRSYFYLADPWPAKAPTYATHDSAGQLQQLNTAELRPAKGLHRAHRVEILRLEGSSARFESGRRDDDISLALHPGPASESCGTHTYVRRHPTVLTPGPSEYGNGKHRSLSSSYPWSTSKKNRNTRPLTVYSPYRPPGVESNEGPQYPRVHDSISLCGSPITYSEYNSDTPSTYGPSYGPRSPAYSPRRGRLSSRGYSFSGSSTQRFSQIQPYHHPHPQARASEAGAEFAPVSPGPPASNLPPSPIDIPRPPPTSIPTSPPVRGRQWSFSSTRSRMRTPSPAYGALNPLPSLPKQASFLHRAQARLEQGFIKVRLKSPRSFTVRSVTQSPSTSVKNWGEGEGMKWESPDSVVASPSIGPSWSERMKNLAQDIAHAGGETASATPPTPQILEAGMWKRMDDPKMKRYSWERDDTELVDANKFASPLPTPPTTPPPPPPNPYPSPPPSPPPTQNALRRVPKLRIETNFARFSTPPIEAVELEAPLSKLSQQEPFRDSRANGLISPQSSNDSLFLNVTSRGDGGEMPRDEATLSFFASRYAQNRATFPEVETGMETEGTSDESFLSRPRQSDEATSSFFASKYAQNRAITPGMEMGRKGDESPQSEPQPRVRHPVTQKLKENRVSILSWEQLAFAALPSALEDLGKPFPFGEDDRMGLPSQIQPHDAPKRHTLSRKRGMRLR